MSGRVWLLFGVVLLTITLCFREPHAHELPCFGKEQAAMLEPKENLRGFGTTSEGLVKLSVSSSGAWMLTFSPPKMNGAVCIVWLGEGWEVITSAGKRAQWTAR